MTKNYSISEPTAKLIEALRSLNTTDDLVHEALASMYGDDFNQGEIYAEYTKVFDTFADKVEQLLGQVVRINMSENINDKSII